MLGFCDSVGIQLRDGGRQGCRGEEVCRRGHLPGGRCCEARAGAREGRVCLCAGSCRASRSWQRCQDVSRTETWWAGLRLLGSSVPGAMRGPGLAGMGDGGDQSLHPIWWFSLAEMPSLASSRQGRVVSNRLRSLPWGTLPGGTLPWGTLPCRGALPAVTEPRLGLFVRRCWVRLVSHRSFLESPWAGRQPNLSPLVGASDFTRVMQTTLGLWSQCAWHCPRGWEQGPVAQQCLGSPCPDLDQLSEPA